ncbi:MAG: holo-ACP synthase [Pirellulaceae bacterium]|nr:holo-ACP synthase [Pirellulaceae bacterium]
MQIIGIGTDLCECQRIAGMIQRHGETFLTKVYTAAEIEYCQPHRNSAISYAGRWAAKEAILKALGTGWARGIEWTNLEVLNQPGGQPVVNLTGRAAEVAAEKGISSVNISISHTDTLAIAFAIAVSD